MPLIVGICLVIIVAASVYMIIDVLTAPNYCSRHERVYHGDNCPDCEREWRDAERVSDF